MSFFQIYTLIEYSLVVFYNICTPTHKAPSYSWRTGPDEIGQKGINQPTLNLTSSTKNSNLKFPKIFNRKCMSFHIFEGLEQYSTQGRIKNGETGNCSGAPAGSGPPWWNLFAAYKILIWKIFVINIVHSTRMQLYIIFLCCVKYQGPQQQLISLQVWLSASFCNRYWKVYKYFLFCSMQIYLIFLVTFY